jgi:hypothetical protein
MRGDLRRENARIYSEMYESGIEPFRGSWRSVTVMVLCFLLAVSSVMLLFYVVVASPIDVVHSIFHSFSSAMRRL